MRFKGTWTVCDREIPAGRITCTNDCDACVLKPRCCCKEPARKVPRSIHEGARNMERDLAQTDARLVSRRERKKVEMLFAHLKRILKLDRWQSRGPCSAPPPRTPI